MTGNRAISNGGVGIVTDAASVVTGNTARGNLSTGITATSGSNVSGNAATFNALVGLSLGRFAGYSQNAVIQNNGGDTNPKKMTEGINARLGIALFEDFVEIRNLKASH